MSTTPTPNERDRELDFFKNELERRNIKIFDLETRITTLEKALRYYASPDDWYSFQVTQGSIGSSFEGDTAMAFDCDDDKPWQIASQALDPDGQAKGQA